MENKRVLLCLAHMSGNEMKYIQEAFDTNWVVPRSRCAAEARR